MIAQKMTSRMKSWHGWRGRTKIYAHIPPPSKPKRGGGERRPSDRGDYRPPVFFSTGAATEQWRVGAFSNPYATVFVGADLGTFQAEVDQVRTHFILAVGAGIALSALAGWMIASKAIILSNIFTNWSSELGVNREFGHEPLLLVESCLLFWILLSFGYFQG